MHSASSAKGWAKTYAIFLIFLRLGLTSFGGPSAHLAYFQHEFVQRRRWLSATEYGDLVALCQFLPGPASSQVGFALGWLRHGNKGALAAWLGFTLPSALLMLALALGFSHYRNGLPSDFLTGIKLAVLAIVAHAVWSLGQQLCRTRAQLSLMLLSCCILLCWPGASTQIVVIAGSALIGWRWLTPSPSSPLASAALAQSTPQPPTTHIQRRKAKYWLTIFLLLLLLLPLLAHLSQWPLLQAIAGFYQAGALVFGGGHVVLPMLEAQVVTPGLISSEQFLAGYAAAQVLPGPLFSFAAFLGTLLPSHPWPWLSGLLCLVAIFLPSGLLVLAVLPVWQQLKQQAAVRRALAGANAAVVGLLLAALYQPLWLSSIYQPTDLALALLAWLALAVWQLPAWLLVPLCGLGYTLLQSITALGLAL